MAHQRRFVIREWDGEENVVDVRFFHHKMNKVLITYSDGLTHEVTEEHFWTLVVK